VWFTCVGADRSTRAEMLVSRRSVYILALALFCQYAVAKVLLTETDDLITVQNGYTYVSFNKRTSAIDTIAADFSGSGAYSENNLARPFSLQVGVNGRCSAPLDAPPVTLSWLDKTDKIVRLTVSNVIDRTTSICDVGATRGPVVSEEWTISLAEGERSVTVDISGQVLRDASVDYVLHGIYTNSPSLYGLFPQGVAQMMGNTNACMGSTNSLSRAYVLGNGAAMDVIRHNHNQKPDFNSDGAHETGSPSTVVFKSAHQSFASGIEDVIFGTYPTTSDLMPNAWTKTCWNDTVPTALTKGTTYAFGLTFLPNNYDFPAYLLNNVTATASTVPFDQLRAYLTGAYASPAGCLQSYYGLQFGTIAPTIAHPDVGYSPDTNFFDPDNFISLSALLYSGDPYFIRQVRLLLFALLLVLYLFVLVWCGCAKERICVGTSFCALR
jgi:hypothetical protein